jgi:hypothetical protein
MNAANAAVQKAENDDDVPVYAADQLARAKQLQGTMQTEADAKRYDSAKDYAQQTVDAANKAINDAKTGADAAQNAKAAQESALAQAKNNWDAASKAMDRDLADTQEAIKGIKSIKHVNIDMAKLDSDFAAAQALAKTARDLAASGQYENAVAKTRDVRTALADIQKTISAASLTTINKKNK